MADDGSALSAGDGPWLAGDAAGEQVDGSNSAKIVVCELCEIGEDRDIRPVLLEVGPAAGVDFG